MESMIQNLYDSIPLWGVYSIVHDNIHIKDIHILLRKSKSSKREMNGTSAWHTKLRLSQFILSSSVFMEFYFLFSYCLVKVLYWMLQTICSVFSLSILTFTKTCSQPSFEFGFVLFSSSSKKSFQVHFLHFVFVRFQLIFDIFYFIFHFYYKYFNWIIIKTSSSTLKHFLYFLL